MKDNRLLLHEELCTILGTRNVYFQPPELISMKYPAIVYSRDDIINIHSDNQVYGRNFKYKVTVIDSNPDSQIVDNMLSFKFAVFDRHFNVNNLNHTQFTITYNTIKK